MKYFFIIFCLLSVRFAHGQSSPNLSTFLNECIIKGISSDAYLSTKKNFAHFYSITISFDPVGRIDTLYFSNDIAPITKRIYSLDNSLIKRIKKYDFKFPEYSSKLVLIPIYYYNIGDKSVSYEDGFLNSVENIFPGVAYGKDIIILKPIIDANVPREIN